jgi:hypothetical protein
MSPPKLYCQPGGIGGQLLQQCTSVKRPFVPSFWAPTKHSQNVLSCEYRAPTAAGQRSCWAPSTIVSCQQHVRHTMMVWGVLTTAATPGSPSHLCCCGGSMPSRVCFTSHPTANACAVLRTLSVRGSYTRQHIMTDDGGTLGLDWWQGSDKPGAAPATAPILLIIHGINGGWCSSVTRQECTPLVHEHSLPQDSLACSSR